MPDDAPPQEAPSSNWKLLPLVVVGLALGIWLMKPAGPGARFESDLARAAAAIDAGNWLDAAPILERIARDKAAPEAQRRKASADRANVLYRALEVNRRFAQQR